MFVSYSWIIPMNRLLRLEESWMDDSKWLISSQKYVFQSHSITYEVVGYCSFQGYKVAYSKAQNVPIACFVPLGQNCFFLSLSLEHLL